MLKRLWQLHRNIPRFARLPYFLCLKSKLSVIAAILLLLFRFLNLNVQAYICQGDALMSIGKLDAAKKSYSIALELDPSLRRSKSFKVSQLASQVK